MSTEHESAMRRLQERLQEQQTRLLKNSQDGVSDGSVYAARNAIENAIGTWETRVDLKGAFANATETENMRYSAKSHAERLVKELGIDNAEFRKTLEEEIYDRRGGAAFSGTNVISTDEILASLDAAAKEHFPGSRNFMEAYAKKLDQEVKPNPEQVAMQRTARLDELRSQRKAMETHLNEQHRTYDGISNDHVDQANEAIENAINGHEIRVDLEGLFANSEETEVVRSAADGYASVLVNSLKIHDRDFEKTLADEIFSRRGGAAFSGTNVVSVDEIKDALDSAARKHFGHNDFAQSYAQILQDRNGGPTDAGHMTDITREIRELEAAQQEYNASREPGLRAEANFAVPAMG